MERKTNFPLFAALGLNAITMLGAAFYTGSYVNDISTAKANIATLIQFNRDQSLKLATIEADYKHIQEKLEEIKEILKER